MKTDFFLPRLLLALSLQPLALLAQGTLTPPGPPAPTMKSLAQIEPRLPISSLPFSISSPGSYYVTTNLTGFAGQNGITVAADNVTIDLNGFELAGVPGSSSGVGSPSAHTNLVVRNGTLRDWGVWGVGTGNTTAGIYEHLNLSRDASGALNIGNDSLVLECIVSRCPTSAVVFPGIGAGTGCVIRNCVVIASANVGIQTGSGSTVTGCTVEYPAANGIAIGSASTITGCAVNSGSSVGIAAAQNSSVLDCNASYNSGSGITAGNGTTVKNCIAGNNGGAGIAVFDAGTIQNCATRQNNNGGILAGNASTLSDCIVVNNINDGITIGNGTTVSHCAISGNQNGILAGNNCLILSCVCSLNSSNGVFAGVACNIKDCTVSQNAASGIRAAGSSMIAGNVGYNNASGLTNNANIYVTGDDNQILDNNVTSGGRGIKTDTAYNLIVKNKATLSDLNFDLAPNSKAGSITNDPTAAGPWANFSF